MVPPDQAMSQSVDLHPQLLHLVAMLLTRGLLAWSRHSKLGSGRSLVSTLKLGLGRSFDALMVLGFTLKNHCQADQLRISPRPSLNMRGLTSCSCRNHTKEACVSIPYISSTLKHVFFLQGNKLKASWTCFNLPQNCSN